MLKNVLDSQWRSIQNNKFRTVFYVLLIVFIAAIITRNFLVHPTLTNWANPLSGIVIVVDAGHGGPDGGAVSRDGLVEKEINLLIAKYLRDYLQEAGAVVMMTREKDEDLADENPPGSRKTQDLHRRADIIRESGADLFVTIHLNSIHSSRWSGAQTFYYSGHRTSKYLAVFIQDQLRANLQNTDRIAKSADTIYLLKTSPVPSVLVEAGFLSNPQEAQLLAKPDYQKQVAASIYQGILRFYTERDKIPK